MNTRSPTLKVLSYNIHKGFNSLSTKLVLDKIKASLEVTGADIVFLQEVVGANQRHAEAHEGWPTSTQFEFIADTVWPHFSYGQNATYDDGHHGNAILSKFPIVASDNVNLSGGVLDRRGILHAVIRVPFAAETLDVHCLCTHLAIFKRLRGPQYQKIVSKIAGDISAEAPLILAGDFNDWRGEATALLEERLGLIEVFQTLNGDHIRSFPSFLPILRLDRMYTRGFLPQSGSALTGQPWRTLSDHVALYAELGLSQAEAD